MAVNTLTRADLRALTDARPQRGRVLSVFLNLDPAEFASAAARSTAINSVLNEAEREIGQLDGLEHDELVSARDDLERVRAELGRDGLADEGTRGIAIYACGLGGLFEVLRLDHPVRTHAVIERTPYLEPLVSPGQQQNWGVLLVNRRAARIFRGAGTSLEETDSFEDDVHRRHDQGGWSQARFQRGVEKEVGDHIKHVADVLFETHKRTPFDCLLIGTPEEMLPDVERALHPYLRERVCGRLSLDVEHSSPDDVRRVAGEAIEEHRAAHERQLLERLTQNLARSVRAAAGLDHVCDALNQARVEVLLVADGLSEPGLRDPATGTIAREGSSLPGDAPGEPVENIIEEAMEKAVEQSADIVVVRDPEGLVDHGGIAALLRF